LNRRYSYPDSWSTGSYHQTNPQERGQKNPNNYRGIILLPVLSKIFTAIIRDRLVDWAEANGKLNEAQFGFRGGRRTTDPISILSTAVQAFKKRRKPL
jgi:hypothetical protein